MITDIRTQTFIESLDGGNTPFLEELEKWAHENDIPIIKRPAQGLLKFFLADIKPKKVLEIGCAVGFSAILMATYGPNDMRITTVENYEKRIPIAKDNFKKSGFEDRIELHFMDALELLEKLAEANERYDMIFIDAAKAQYIRYLPYAKQLLNDGGLLISDNVLQDGDIVQSRFAVTRRNRTIHSRMREYLKALSDDEELTTVILPIADGMTVSVKSSTKG